MEQIDKLRIECNARLAELDIAIAAALDILNRVRALHAKKAFTPEDFMKFYRGQKLQ